MSFAGGGKAVTMPPKMQRRQIKMSGSFSFSDFVKECYRVRGFLFFPGNVFIVFKQKPTWFSCERSEQIKLGTELYKELVKKNSFLENFGVRFFFTYNEKNKTWQIEQSVQESKPIIDTKSLSESQLVTISDVVDDTNDIVEKK